MTGIRTHCSHCIHHLSDTHHYIHIIIKTSYGEVILHLPHTRYVYSGYNGYSGYFSINSLKLQHILPLCVVATLGFVRLPVVTKTSKNNMKEKFQMKNIVKNLMPIPEGYIVLTKVSTSAE